MERGEVIRWVNELATTGWDREKPFSIRAIGDSLNRLVTDPHAGGRSRSATASTRPWRSATDHRITRYEKRPPRYAIAP
jgi:hypothetical protein